MGSLIEISSSLLTTLGCVSLSSADNDDRLSSIGSTVVSTASCISSSGTGINININTTAAQVSQAKAYVQSLTIEEQEQLLIALDKKEQKLVNEEKGRQLIKKL